MSCLKTIITMYKGNLFYFGEVTMEKEVIERLLVSCDTLNYFSNIWKHDAYNPQNLCEIRIVTMPTSSQLE